MKDGHTTKSESSFGKKLWCVLIVVILGGIGWQMWKLNAYNNAVREAKEAGFTWECEDAFSLIKQDWHNALKKETWGAHERVLYMGIVPDLGRYREMLHHLRPTVLVATDCKDENLDSLKGLTALQTLYLINCTALKNLDGLKGLIALRTLNLRDCTALQNIDVLKSLTGLQRLGIGGCPTLQNADVLKGLTGLEDLKLIRCPALLNVDALKGLAGLQTLFISDCTALQNVEGLKSLLSLQRLVLFGCDKIPAAALRELDTALPNTYIDLNPPNFPGL